MASDATLPAPSPRRSLVRAIAIVAAVCLLGCGVYTLNSRQKALHAQSPAPQGAHSGAPAGGHKAEGGVEVASSAPTKPVDVIVETISSRSINEPLRVTGTLKTDEVVTLSTKATGMVQRVTVKEGDRVRKGQLLVEVDDSDIRAQRDRALAAVQAAEAQREAAEALVRSAEAKLQQARTSREMKDVGAETEYRRAQQALATAQSRLSQAKSLAEITVTESDSRVASAKSALQSARERLKSLQEGSRRQEKAAAEAAVSRAQAQVARMKSTLERREQLLRDKAIAAEVVDNARRDYEVALTDLDAAKQQLSLVREGPRSEEIRMAEESVRQAEATLRDAEANRARRQISDEDVEAAESAVKQSEAALEAAKANLAQKSWNEGDIRNAEAAVKQAQAQVSQARAAASQARADVRYQDQVIGQTRIYSPVNGVVTERKVTQGGAVVQMRNELMTLVSSDTLYFEATAPETALSQIRAGMPAAVILDAVPGKVFGGLLREIIPVAQGTNRSVRLRIAIPKPPQGLAVVGGFARAELRGSSAIARMSVPREALSSDEGQMGVYVVDGNVARYRPIEVGDPGGSGDRVPVGKGLRPGDQVIVKGMSSLTDGRPVNVLHTW